jgi:hypothetical protein
MRLLATCGGSVTLEGTSSAMDPHRLAEVGAERYARQAAQVCGPALVGVLAHHPIRPCDEERSRVLRLQRSVVTRLGRNTEWTRACSLVSLMRRSASPPAPAPSHAGGGGEGGAKHTKAGGRGGRGATAADVRAGAGAPRDGVRVRGPPGAGARCEHGEGVAGTAAHGQSPHALVLTDALLPAPSLSQAERERSVALDAESQRQLVIEP